MFLLRRTFFLLLLLIESISSNAQDWDWAVTSQYSGAVSYVSHFFPNGDAIITGTYTDSIRIGNTILKKPEGKSAVYISWLDHNGNFTNVMEDGYYATQPQVTAVTADPDKMYT